MQSDVGDRMLAREIQWNSDPPGAGVVRSIKEITRALSVKDLMNVESLLTPTKKVEGIIITNLWC